jgi:hypothetical protein
VNITYRDIFKREEGEGNYIKISYDIIEASLTRAERHARKPLSWVR